MANNNSMVAVYNRQNKFPVYLGNERRGYKSASAPDYPTDAERLVAWFNSIDSPSVNRLVALPVVLSLVAMGTGCVPGQVSTHEVLATGTQVGVENTVEAEPSQANSEATVEAEETQLPVGAETQQPENEVSPTPGPAVWGPPSVENPPIFNSSESIPDFAEPFRAAIIRGGFGNGFTIRFTDNKQTVDEQGRSIYSWNMFVEQNSTGKKAWSFDKETGLAAAFPFVYRQFINSEGVAEWELDPAYEVRLVDGSEDGVVGWSGEDFRSSFLTSELVTLPDSNQFPRDFLNVRGEWEVNSDLKRLVVFNDSEFWFDAEANSFAAVEAHVGNYLMVNGQIMEVDPGTGEVGKADVDADRMSQTSNGETVFLKGDALVLALDASGQPIELAHGYYWTKSDGSMAVWDGTEFATLEGFKDVSFAEVPAYGNTIVLEDGEGVIIGVDPLGDGGLMTVEDMVSKMGYELQDQYNFTRQGYSIALESSRHGVMAFLQPDSGKWLDVWAMMPKLIEASEQVPNRQFTLFSPPLNVDRNGISRVNGMSAGLHLEGDIPINLPNGEPFIISHGGYWMVYVDVPDVNDLTGARGGVTYVPLDITVSRGDGTNQDIVYSQSMIGFHSVGGLSEAEEFIIKRELFGFGGESTGFFVPGTLFGIAWARDSRAMFLELIRQQDLVLSEQTPEVQEYFETMIDVGSTFRDLFAENNDGLPPNVVLGELPQTVVRGSYVVRLNPILK